MTDTATVEAPQEAAEQPQDPALQEGARLFKYSEYVHLGPGAEDCPGGSDGSCEDPEHYHAWVRLPNPYQHREISDRARAAQARKRRQLKDSETDGFAILEGELDELRQASTKKPIVDAMVSKDWAEDYLQAITDLGEQDEWKNIEQDQRRMNEIDALPDEDQPKDEFLELSKHLEAYREALEARVKVLTDPKRAAFEEKDVNALVDDLREQRIEQISTEDYLHVYGAWEMVVGTFSVKVNKSGRHTERLYGHVDALRDEPPEVLDALKTTLDRLRVSHQEAASGNS